jgi:hypothetical protein
MWNKFNANTIKIKEAGHTSLGSSLILEKLPRNTKRPSTIFLVKQIDVLVYDLMFSLYYLAFFYLPQALVFLFRFRYTKTNPTSSLLHRPARRFKTDVKFPDSHKHDILLPFD